MIIKQTLSETIKKFNKNNLKNPHLEAEFLLSYILKKSREYILSHREYKLSLIEYINLKYQIYRRCKGVPLAYITGQKSFYGLNFKVNRHVLVPRPETELIIEEVVNNLHDNFKNIIIIDIGTGSGCIIISLAKKLQKYTFLATDISKKALKMALKNAKMHNVDNSIKFYQGNLLEPIINDKFDFINNDIIICANLPYGWHTWKNNSSAETIGLKFEPPTALFTGKNGLELYEKLFKQLNNCFLKINKKHNIAVLCEIDPRQSEKIIRLAQKILPEFDQEIKKDLSGLNRLFVLKN